MARARDVELSHLAKLAHDTFRKWAGGSTKWENQPRDVRRVWRSVADELRSEVQGFNALRKYCEHFNVKPGTVFAFRGLEEKDLYKLSELLPDRDGAVFLSLQEGQSIREIPADDMRKAGWVRA